MIFAATDYTGPIVIGGGAAGLLSFVLAFSKIWSSDRVWTSLVKEVRSELTECRADRQAQTEAHAAERVEWESARSGMLTEIRNLNGQVVALRRLVHTDMWTGTDPESVRLRRLFDQEAEETD